jgi:hypothetical protein
METVEVDYKDKKVSIVIRDPSNLDLAEADKAYRRVQANLIRNNLRSDTPVLTRDQLDEFLEKNGIWTKVDNDRVRDLLKQLDDISDTLFNKGGLSLKEGRALAVKATDLRREVMSLSQRRQKFANTTVEYLSEQEYTQELIFRCTVNSENGKRFWETREDMEDDSTEDVYFKASDAINAVLYGVSTNFIKELPEFRWLQKYGFIDEQFRFVDRKTKEPVDENGVLVEKQADEAKVEFKPFTDDETGEPVVI